MSHNEPDASVRSAALVLCLAFQGPQLLCCTGRDEGIKRFNNPLREYFCMLPVSSCKQLTDRQHKATSGQHLRLQQNTYYMCQALHAWPSPCMTGQLTRRSIAGAVCAERGNGLPALSSHDDGSAARGQGQRASHRGRHLHCSSPAAHQST